MAEVRERMVIDVQTTGISQLKSQFAAAAAAMLSVGAAIKLFNTAVSEARNAVEAVRAVESRIASTGGAAGVSTKQLQAWANELQNTSNYGDEAVLSMSQLLLTFTKISGETFPRAQKVIADMATVIGTDLKSSAIQVGKALQSPEIGLTALRRVGVNFTKDQQEVIKSLFETGKVAEAQAMILSELETEFGGAAQAMARSSTQLKNAYGDLLEVAGKQVLPMLDAVNLAFKNHIMSLTQSLQNSLDETKAYQQQMFVTWNRAISGIITTFQAVGNVLVNEAVIIGTNVSAAFKIIPTALFDAIKLTAQTATNFKSIFSAIKTGWNNSFDEMFPNAFKNTTQLIKDTIGVNRQALTSLKNTIKDAEKSFEDITWKSLTDFNKTLFTTVKTAGEATDELTKLSEAVSEITTGKGKAGGRGKADRMRAISDELRNVQTEWQNFGQDMRDVSENQIASALNMMILSHETAFAKLRSIMHSFVNAMISEINRYLAKLAIRFIIEGILGFATGGAGMSLAGAAVGSGLLGGGGKTMSFGGGFGGGLGTGGMPSIGNERSMSQSLLTALNTLNNRPVEVKVYVDPREISRANQLGTSLRYANDQA